MRRFFTAIFLLTPMILPSYAAMASDYAADDTDEREYRFIKGVINKAGRYSLILNERSVVNMTSGTRYFDAHGRQIVFALDEGQWVYVEGVLEANGDVEAESIYLLKSPVKGNGRYEFMQTP